MPLLKTRELRGAAAAETVVSSGVGIRYETAARVFRREPRREH